MDRQDTLALGKEMIDPVIITGCPRSGTSLTAGILAACGAFFGSVRRPNQRNAKGFFENLTIQNMVSTLRRGGVGIQEDGIRIMQLQGYNDGVWVVKSVAACKQLDSWCTAFPNAKWIFVCRDQDDIIASHKRVESSITKEGLSEDGFNRYHRKLPKGWDGYVESFTSLLPVIRQETKFFMEYWPQTIIDGDLVPAKEMVEYAGLEWDEKAVTNFVDKSLWRGQNG